MEIGSKDEKVGIGLCPKVMQLFVTQSRTGTIFLSKSLRGLMPHCKSVIVKDLPSAAHVQAVLQTCPLNSTGNKHKVRECSR